MRYQNIVTSMMTLTCIIGFSSVSLLADSGKIHAPRLDGFCQFRCNYLKPDNNDDDYTVGFQAAKGRLGVRGEMFGALASYRILTELFGTSSSSNATNPKLLDYYMILKICRSARVKIGQFKVPFTRQYYQSASKNAFTDHARPVKAQRDGRDIGIEIFADDLHDGFLEYRVGLFNGNGSNMSSNDNKDLEAAGRIMLKWNGFNPYSEGFQGHKPGCAVGFSSYINHLTNVVDTVSTSEEKIGTGIDLTAGIGGFFLAGEYVGVNKSIMDDETFSGGYYIQIGYMILPKSLELQGRYAIYDPDDKAKNDTETEYRFGATFFQSGHKHKLTVETGSIHLETGQGESTRSILASLQYQFSFN